MVPGDRRVNPATEISGDRAIGMDDVTIDLESVRQPEVVRLIEEMDAYHIALYPAESNHRDSTKRPVSWRVGRSANMGRTR